MLTAGAMGEAIWFEEEGGGRGRYVTEMEQPPLTAADAIIVRVDGLPLASGCTWSILAAPPNLLPTAGLIVVPQGGVVE
jgi:hypothetical protein